MSGAPAPVRLEAALGQACASLEAAARSAKADWAAHGAAHGASELLDWTEEIEAAIRELSAALREIPAKGP